MVSELKSRIDEAGHYVLARSPIRPQVGIILGTGLGDFAALETSAIVPYRHTALSGFHG